MGVPQLQAFYTHSLDYSLFHRSLMLLDRSNGLELINSTCNMNYTVAADLSECPTLIYT